MSGKKKPRSKRKSEVKADFPGFASDDSGPRELIDLSDIKDELVKEAEDIPKVAASTPFVTPVNSPTRQACAESNSVRRSRELFEALDRAEVKAARELVIPSFGGGISPVKPSTSALKIPTSAQSQSKTSGNTSGNNSVSSKTRQGDNKKMVVDEVAAEKSCQKLLQVVKLAEDDVVRLKLCLLMKREQ